MCIVMKLAILLSSRVLERMQVPIFMLISAIVAKQLFLLVPIPELDTLSFARPETHQPGPQGREVASCGFEALQVVSRVGGLVLCPSFEEVS